MADETEALVRLFREMRTGFNLLRELAEKLHAEDGVNTSMRSVMESLAGGLRRTVPDLARERGVSRQHVQTIANGLLSRNLVATVDNPDHKRSPFYRLTSEGEALFGRIRAREQAPMEALADGFAPDDLAAATAILARLNRRIETLAGAGADGSREVS